MLFDFGFVFPFLDSPPRGPPLRAAPSGKLNFFSKCFCVVVCRNNCDDDQRYSDDLILFFNLA